jgi:electron transport complex protein RnfC
MVKLKEHKYFTEDKAIEALPLPSKAYIPLSQHLGKACSILEVNIGDSVNRGQKLAVAAAHIYAPVHASISGKILACQDYPHPVLGRAKAIVIESDGLDKAMPLEQRSKEVIENLTAQEIRDIVFQAGIVGMGGASFPSYIKLNPPKPVDTLLINGAECEPYLTSDFRLMVEKTQEIIKGIDLVRKCLGVKRVYVAIEDNKEEAIEKFKRLNSPFEIKVLKSIYPQGGEKQLIENILGKEVPSGKLPFDIGVVVHNVATIFAIYEAVYLGKPLYERIVTVTGSCLTHPKNLLVRIGTPIRELIDFCGPFKQEPAKIIIGGPMMGIAQYTDMVPIIKSSGGIILLNEKEAKIYQEQDCIRCGACVRECPIRLMPTLIAMASKKEMWSYAKSCGALDCIECGACNYVCPANIMLVQSIKRAKLEIK